MSRSPKPGVAGAFVVIVGPDGTGKTTLARALCATSHRPVAYFHFRPRLRGPFATCPPESTDPPRVKVPARRRGDLVRGWARLLRTGAHSALAYWLRIRPAMRDGMLVVGDRWIFGYLTQPEPLRYYGPAWLARLIVRLAAPEPSLTVNLTAPVPVLLSRKQELTADRLALELAATQRLPVTHLLTLSSELPPTTLAAQVLDHVPADAGPSDQHEARQGGMRDRNDER